MYPLPHLSLHLLHFPLCWPHSRQAHCPHGGHQHFLAGPQACPVQPTLKRGHLFPGSSGKHTLIHFHWLPGVHAFCRSKLCGQGGGKEQADRSPPLVGLSPLGGGAGRGSPQKETGAFKQKGSEFWAGHKPTGVQHRNNSGCSKKCVQKGLWARRASPPHARPRTGTKEGGAPATAVRAVIIVLPVFWCIFF